MKKTIEVQFHPEKTANSCGFHRSSLQIVNDLYFIINGERALWDRYLSRALFVSAPQSRECFSPVTYALSQRDLIAQFFKRGQIYAFALFFGNL